MTSTSTSKQIGKVALTPAGNWDNTNEYEKLDVVYYQGGSYVAKKAVPVTTNITNEEYWQALAEKAPSLTIGTVSTVSAETGASASIGGTADEPTLNLSIPRGVAGNESIDDTAGEGDTDKVWSADRDIEEIENFNAIVNDAYTYEELAVDATSTGWRLTLDGYCSSNANYNIVKYKVTAGFFVKVISDDRFQFQNQGNIPSSGTKTIVGHAYEKYNGILQVPTGATYIVFSTPAEDSIAKCYDASFIVDDIAPTLEFKRNNDLQGIELYLHKKINMADSTMKLVKAKDRFCIKIPSTSPVFLFNKNMTGERLIYDLEQRIGITISNYYNNGVNSISSKYIKDSKNYNNYVVAEFAMTDLSTLKIEYFKNKTSNNNNLITEILPFEIYGNICLRYNADAKLSQIITKPGYVNFKNGGSGVIHWAALDSNYGYSSSEYIDATRYSNEMKIESTNYVVSWTSSQMDYPAVTENNYRRLFREQIDKACQVISSDELSLTASKLKILPEHSSRYWSAKKFAFLGDSLTQDAPYYPFLVKALEITDYKAVGRGGSSMEGSGDYSMWKDVRINAIPEDTDVVIIMAGTNGVGELGDLTLANHDTSKFIGAYNVCLSKIYYRFGVSTGYYNDVDYTGVDQASEARDIQIIIVTPPYYRNQQTIDKIFTRGNALKQMSLLWGLPLVDSIPTMQTNPMNDSIAFPEDDGTHYNERNRRKLANAIIGKLRELEPIAENYTSNVS